MQKITINFSDFWPGFNKKDNFFWHLLSQNFHVELADNPDILIYSVFGCNFVRYNCIRVFYTGENIRPNFQECDYAFSFDYTEDNRNYRLPIYALYADVKKLLEPKPTLNDILRTKTKFCNFIVSNPYAKKRIDFFHKLSQYKKVDSGGKVLNNIGGPVANKWEFIKEYKFTIAFENESHPGYTTEKIFEPFLFHSIPIYWGNPFIDRDFNTKSFVNYHHYGDDEAVIEQIITIDSNPDLYAQYLLEPYFIDNKVNRYVDTDNILKKFEEIFSMRTHITPIAQTQSSLYKYRVYSKYIHSRYRAMTRWLQERLG